MYPPTLPGENFTNPFGDGVLLAHWRAFTEETDSLAHPWMIADQPGPAVGVPNAVAEIIEMG